MTPKLTNNSLGLEDSVLVKVLKKYKNHPCLWDTTHKYYHNKPVKNTAWDSLLQVWRRCQPQATLHDVKIKIFHMRTNYTRQRRKVESCASASVVYKPTLWYYKHLNFLSGNKDTDSEESDSDNNDDTLYVQLPRGQKRPASTSIEQEESEPSVDPSAAAFGRSVGAQLHQLSKMQRCIAEKLISDVIYHAKMEQLSLDTCINVEESSEIEALIPESGPSCHDTDTATSEQEPTSSTVLTAEELAQKEIEETESAVSFIKMEANDTENYIFHDVDEEPSLDIVKQELL